MRDGVVLVFTLDPVLEMVYNLCAIRRMPKISHVLQFRHAIEDSTDLLRRVRESAGALDNI